MGEPGAELVSRTGFSLLMQVVFGLGNAIGETPDLTRLGLHL
jgi:hypothetical protein